jgi:hypothetical protein
MHIKIGKAEYEFPEGIKVIDIAREYLGDSYRKILAATANNRFINLNQTINADCNINFIDLASENGERIYARSLAFVLSKAVKDLYPEGTLTVEHSLGNGLYCEINNVRITETIASKLEARMAEIVKQDIPLIPETVPVDEAIERFSKEGSREKAEIIGYSSKKSIDIYSIDGYTDCLYGPLVPSTGYLKLFKLRCYLPGLLILYPHGDSPDTIPPFRDLPKLAAVFKESENWGRILNISYAASLNRDIETGQAKDLVLISEALHEKR